MNKKETIMNRIIDNIRRTRKNKIYALAGLGLGVASTMVSNDYTFLIIVACFAVPLFFAKENWIL